MVAGHGRKRCVLRHQTSHKVNVKRWHRLRLREERWEGAPSPAQKRTKKNTVYSKGSG